MKRENDDAADKIAKRMCLSINKIAPQLGEKEELDPEAFYDNLPADYKLIARKIIQQCAGALSNDGDFIILGMWSRGEHE